MMIDDGNQLAERAARFQRLDGKLASVIRSYSYRIHLTCNSNWSNLAPRIKAKS
jgi:hypothetical protein